MFVSLRVSLKHALLLVYLLLVLLVVALLVRETRSNSPPFSAAGSLLLQGSDTRTLVVQGKGFHPGIKGALLKSLVNEEAFLWQRFSAVPLRVFDVSGRFGLFAFNTDEVISVAFSADKPPRLLDSLPMPGHIGEIRIIDNKALVGLTLGAGASLVDMSDPEDLKLIESFAFSGSVNGMLATEKSFYFAGRKLGVARLDLAAENPEPEILHNMDLPWRMAVQDERMVVGALNGQVVLFELDAAGRPVEVKKLDFPGQVRGVAFTEEALNVVVDDGRLFVFDLSAWPNLNQVGQLPLPAAPLDIKPVPGQERVVVSMPGDGLALVDVSLQKSPTLAGRLKVPKTYLSFRVTSEMILATSSTGLDAISLAEIEAGKMAQPSPEAMISEQPYRLQAWHQAVYGFDKQGLSKLIARAPLRAPVSEPYLPIADEQGVGLYTQGDEGQLKRVASVLMKEGVLAARLQSGYLYVAYSGGLRVFSVEDSAEVRVVADLLIPGRVLCFEFLVPETVMVATKSQGVLLVDVSDPAMPKQLSRLSLPRDLQGSSASAILVDGPRAFVSQGTSGVNVLDVSSPQQPKVLQVIDTPTFASVMALHDDFLFVADLHEGLFVIDVRDKQRALTVGNLNVPLRVREMVVADDGLIVSSLRGGSMKLPWPRRLQGLRLAGDRELRVELPEVERGHSLYLYDEVTASRVAVPLD